jgi:hypothetical protein
MPTKLGLHILRAAPDISEYIQAGAAVVKCVGEWGLAKDVPEGMLVVGRKFQGDYDAQLQRSSGKTPLEAAQQFVGDQLGVYQLNPHIVYWEGHNEPVWSTPEEMSWYAQFEIERMKLMAQHGLRCVLGNFAAGTPPLELWPAFLPAIREGLKFKAILGLHEYSCPWLWWMTGSYQIDPDADEGDEGWTTLRYRKVYRQYLSPNDLGHMPLAITECGLDPMVGPQPPGSPGGAWRDLGRFWREHDNEPDAADYYYRQLVWYDEELQKDDYVVGATIFTFGSWGGTWSRFDVAGSDVAKKLTAYAKKHPAEKFQYPEEGDGNGDENGDDNGEEKPRGHPRVQYERTYVLLPPDADAAWAHAVVDGAWEGKRYTIGSSADDAGIGDLDVRRILAVNPQRWSGGAGALERFYAEHYPGVDYQALTAATPQELAQKLSDD